MKQCFQSLFSSCSGSATATTDKRKMDHGTQRPMLKLKIASPTSIARSSVTAKDDNQDQIKELSNIEHQDQDQIEQRDGENFRAMDDVVEMNKNVEQPVRISTLTGRQNIASQNGKQIQSIIDIPDDKLNRINSILDKPNSQNAQDQVQVGASQYIDITSKNGQSQRFPQQNNYDNFRSQFQKSVAQIQSNVNPTSSSYDISNQVVTEEKPPVTSFKSIAAKLMELPPMMSVKDLLSQPVQPQQSAFNSQSLKPNIQSINPEMQNQQVTTQRGQNYQSSLLAKQSVQQNFEQSVQQVVSNEQLGFQRVNQKPNQALSSVNQQDIYEPITASQQQAVVKSLNQSVQHNPLNSVQNQLVSQKNTNPNASVVQQEIQQVNQVDQQEIVSVNQKQANENYSGQDTAARYIESTRFMKFSAVAKSALQKTQQNFTMTNVQKNDILGKFQTLNPKLRTLQGENATQSVSQKQEVPNVPPEQPIAQQDQQEAEIEQPPYTQSQVTGPAAMTQTMTKKVVDDAKSAQSSKVTSSIAAKSVVQNIAEDMNVKQPIQNPFASTTKFPSPTSADSDYPSRMMFQTMQNKSALQSSMRFDQSQQQQPQFQTMTSKPRTTVADNIDKDLLSLMTSTYKKDQTFHRVNQQNNNNYVASISGVQVAKHRPRPDEK